MQGQAADGKQVEHLLRSGKEEVRVDGDDGGDDAEPGDEEGRQPLREVGAGGDPDKESANKVDGCRRHSF